MKKISVIICVLLMLTVLSGCSGYGNTELVNTTEYNSNEFNSLNLDFDADNISVLKSENKKIVLKEYMNKDKNKYYAKIDKSGLDLNIKEGDRPLSTSFESYIELYIPFEYDGKINLHSTSGVIQSDIDFKDIKASTFDTTSGKINISNLNTGEIILSTTSGEINGGNLTSQKITVNTTSGNTELNKINGNIEFTGKSGSINGRSLTGSGNYKMTGDGDVNLDFIEVNNNINVYSKNHSVYVTLPEALSFNFTAQTKDGEVNTYFDHLLKAHEDVTAGTIGNSPSVDIDIESRNGDIVVEK